MTSQVHALLHFGYTPDDQGLRSFIVDYDALSRDKLSEDGKSLFELTRKRWNAMVRRAFDVDLDVQELPVEQARQLSSILSLKMQSDEFMETIDKAMVGRVIGLRRGDSAHLVDLPLRERQFYLPKFTVRLLSPP
jgi:hypothetical protein